MVSLFFCGFTHSTIILLSLSLPLYLYTPIYICSIFHTILCKYSGHLSPLSIYLSYLIYLSHLSPCLLSNIYYIYNKYPIYLSLPYNLYTHDHICSIFIIDYVIIQVISNDSYISSIYLSHIYLILLSPCRDISIDWLIRCIDVLDLSIY